MNSAKIHTGLRSLVGLLFLVFGLNGFLQFIPVPPPTEAGGAFLGALAQAGYMFPLIKITEIVFGALLLANLWTPLALIVLAPVSLNIFLYHVVLDPAGGAPAYFIFIAHLYLGFSRLEWFGPILKRKV